MLAEERKPPPYEEIIVGRGTAVRSLPLLDAVPTLGQARGCAPTQGDLAVRNLAWSETSGN